MFDQPYYVTPGAGAGTAKAYRLMVDAMRDAGKAAVGRFVLRQKEHLVALRVKDDLLLMETLIYADEIVSVASLDGATAAPAEVNDREREVAAQLVAMLSAPFESGRYRDEYREAVLALIERKVAGEEISFAPEAPEPVAVPDLMAALQASVAAVAERQAAPAAKAATKRPRRQPAAPPRKVAGKS